MKARFLYRRLSMRHDLFITMLGGLGVVLGIFVMNGYMARVHGLETLGEYLFVRRTAYAAMGVLLLGMHIGLPNYIARDNQKGFGDSALLSFIFLTVPLSAILMLSVRLGLVEGFNPDYVWAYLFYTVGVCAQSLTYGLYRGRMNMIGANVIQLAASALIPLVVAVVLKRVDQILSTTGVCILILSVGGYLIRNGGFNVGRIKWGELKRLWLYGIERIPSLLFQFVLIAGVPIIAVSFVSFTELSYLNAGISLVRVFLLIVGPLGILLLPRVSHLLSKGGDLKVRQDLELLVRCAVFYGTLGGISLSLFGPQILKIWLGNVSDQGGLSTSLLLLSVPFFVMVEILRSPIDAASQRGYNSLIFGLGAAGLVATFFVLKALGVPALTAGVLGFVSGQVVSAAFSLIIARQLLHIRAFHSELIWSLFVSVLFLVGAFFITVRVFSSHEIQMVFYFLVTAAGLGIFTLRSSQEWMRQLRARLFQ